MAHRLALSLAVLVLVGFGTGCSKSDQSQPEGYNKQEMMRHKPTFGLSGAGAATSKKGKPGAP